MRRNGLSCGGGRMVQLSREDECKHASKLANKVTGANSRPASQFERRRLRQRALVVESHGPYHGGAAVAQFCRSACSISCGITSFDSLRRSA
jgi:hypothetical protein